MAIKTYAGSCHCGAVRFEADVDLSKGTNRCNCSICTKGRSWFVLAKPSDVRLIVGSEAPTEHQWLPPGRPHSFLRYQFCRTCGIRTFGRGGDESQGTAFCFVNVAALDDTDPDELAGAIRYVDGRHDRFDQPAPDRRPM
jgi:hypothetical protein